MKSANELGPASAPLTADPTEWSLADSTPLDLPLDRPRSRVPSFRRGMVSSDLDAAATDALEAVAAESRASLYDALLGGYALLLSRYGSRSSIRVGAPCGGEPAASGTSAPATKLAVIGIDLSGALTVREAIGRAATGAGAAGNKRNAPFASPMESASGYGDPPLVQCLFVANGLRSPLTDEPLRAWRASGRLAVHVARSELVLTTSRESGRLMISLDYDAALFDEQTARRMLGHYTTILREMGSRPDAPAATLSLLTPGERAELLVRWNDTELPTREDACVHDLIQEQAARTPHARAFIAGEETLSYEELERRANRLARYLVERGVGSEVLVGIRLERSADMLVAALATLKAGGAYLPLDPSYPEERLRYMIEDSGIRVVVTRAELAGDDHDPAGPVQVLLDLEEGAIRSESDAPLARRAAPANLAYVIYTSGSTGRPKGVMVEHRNVVNFFAAMDARLGTEPGVWLSVTSLSFDISVLELFWTLARGFTVVLYTPESEHGSSAARRGARAIAAPPMEFGLFYFASDDGEQANALGREKYRLLLEGARYADAHGFSAVWTPERHFHTFGGLYPNPALTSAALAVVTERVQLRAGSCVLPLNDPIRVAESWALVDNLSNGRVGISFASGWQPEDFIFAPTSYRERHEIMFREIETVRRLWRGETLTMPGGHGKDVSFGIRPSPVQRELPIWITAGGTPETFRRAGAMGANLLTHLLGQSIEELTDKLGIYRDAWREHGHGPSGGHVTLMLHTFVGDSESQVRAEVRGPLTTYLRGSVSLFTPFAAALGLDMKNLSEADMDALADHAFSRYYETSGLFGTPESCLEMVDRLRAVGVDELACLIDFGIPTETVLANLSRLDRLRELATSRSGGGAAQGAREAAAGSSHSIASLIARHGVTHMQCTPSLAGMLVHDGESAAALRTLRNLLVGGEAFPAALGEKLRELIPDGRIANMYGPTETTIWSTVHELRAGEVTIPIGTPIANTLLYIVDESGNPVPAGVTGELLIGGRGVARGYLNRPDLTADRFIPNRFHQCGGRLYRTGDLARYRADGSVEFVGRVDQQVKVRGHRIELGEIEAALRRHPSVRDAAVILREESAGDRRIVAYLTANGGPAPRVDDLRNHLGSQLPDVMIPTAWVMLDALPLTPNGKIDRKALPAPTPGEQRSATEYTPPRNEAEEAIQAVWREVLKLERIGTQDNFFELGGHSILAIHVINRLRTRLRRELTMTDMFTYPTIRSLAEHLGAVEGVSAPV
jgi:natural product biosynthesis luciferase-like monooxygenase protein